MLKTAVIFHNYLEINFIANNVRYQCVRWRRKPRWLPVAKSKVFRVPERIQVPEEERVELMRLHNNYRTQVRAIRHYLYEELSKTTSTSLGAQLEAKLEEEQHLRCMNENQTWNIQVAEVREKRLLETAEARREIILNRIVLREQLEKEQLEKIEEIVRGEKLKSGSFITAENIDQVISEALANPVDHNFAIDLDGNIYQGRDTKPDAAVPSVEKEKIQTSL